MWKAIKEFFGFYEEVKPEIKQVEVKVKDTAAAVVQTTTAEVAKVAKCGCGRSPTGNCMGLHKLTESEWASHELNPNKVVAEVKKIESAGEAAVKKATARAKKAKEAITEEVKEVKAKASKKNVKSK